MKIIIIAICSLLVAVVAAQIDYSQSRKLFFVVEMESSVTGESQIFYDIGRGIKEQDSSKRVLQRGVFRNYSFVLPSVDIKSIRFDPVNTTSVIKIKHTRIENAQGKIIKIFPVKSFVPIQQIKSMDFSEDMLIVHTVGNANDPILAIENSSFTGSSDWTIFFVQRVWIYFGYALLSFIVMMIFLRTGLAQVRIQKISTTTERLIAYLVANPGASIMQIGLVASIISCYPVVFFGMSFAHPIGAGALYNASPWFPDNFPLDAIAENFRGSDVGATAWSVAPDSVIQHDSLFQYFEFPFWNRYVGGGIPLFAQGQSMIGDVLHWIPVLLDGSAAGWDLKFVLSKAIFAIGMGLLVHRLTENLLAGSLIAISSCFLGFFAWRFNHPAYFVIHYVPWVMLQWGRLGNILALPNTDMRRCVVQGLLLAVVTWLQLNAGAPKEGVITACFIHAFGVVLFCNSMLLRWRWNYSILIACGMGFALVLINAPYWLLFLDALGKSFTYYDNLINVITLPPWALIGFFDNIFFQKYLHGLEAPSTNLFILFGMCSALFNLRILQSNIVYGCWALFTLAMFTAYGWIPDSVLTNIPFINKIQHIGNTFSVPMMIFSLIIAGYGIRDFLNATAKQKKSILNLSCLMFLTLWLVLTLFDPIKFSFNEYVIAIFLMLILGLFSLHWKFEQYPRNKSVMILILVCCFIIIHIRHGMHLMTGVESIDAIVTNPTERPNFSKSSESIDYLKHQITKSKLPARVIGVGNILFPGYNVRLGVEGIVPVDPLINLNFQELISNFYFPAVAWGWLRLANIEEISSRSAFLDLFGVGYIVAEVGSNMPSELNLIHSSDLEVWERKSVWPRAFFVNKAIEINDASDMLGLLSDKSHVPFAAVENQYMPSGANSNNDPYYMLPAVEYTWTNNSTNFTVTANGPGIIVLGENYYPGDFVAEVNGENVDYVRVNEAFKGIWVNKAGKYNVSFRYRPEKLNLSFVMLLSGLVILLFLIRSTAQTSNNNFKIMDEFSDKLLRNDKEGCA